MADAWLHGPGDRLIVHRWKNRGKDWSHAEKWEGVATELLARYRKATGGTASAQLEPYMRSMTCPDCQGARLNPRARAVRVGGKTLVELGAHADRPGRPGSSTPWPASPPPTWPPTRRPSRSTPLSRTIADELLKEIRGRLGFLLNVGLHYLTLDRSAPTLSGGEAQRIRLAGQIGCGLVGVLYILDEPSIGLHPRDNDRLLASLAAAPRHGQHGHRRRARRGHDAGRRLPRRLRPRARRPRRRGRRRRDRSTTLAEAKQSLTGQYLVGRKDDRRARRSGRPGERQTLTVVGAPAQQPQGHRRRRSRSACSSASPASAARARARSSTTSSARRWRRDLERRRTDASPGARTTGSTGLEHLDKVIDIDQSPIGRTPRSNPATYIKLFDEIRDLFAKLPEAKVRGYKPGRFSFNVPGGRCEACEGNGSNRLEMDFLADVWVTCPVCEGKRFNRETLQVRFKGKSIDDVLEMDVQEALEHFENVPQDPRRCCRRCTTSGSTTSSSASRRRRSPAARPSGSSWPASCVKRGTGKTLYILDEPTTGLHFDDVRKLLEVLHGFVDAGQHGRRHRAQPRRDQDGRLGHRPRPRRRRRRRPRSSPRARRRRSPTSPSSPHRPGARGRSSPGRRPAPNGEGRTKAQRRTAGSRRRTGWHAICGPRGAASTTSRTSTSTSRATR